MEILWRSMMTYLIHRRHKNVGRKVCWCSLYWQYTQSYLGLAYAKNFVLVKRY